MGAQTDSHDLPVSTWATNAIVIERDCTGSDEPIELKINGTEKSQPYLTSFIAGTQRISPTKQDTHEWRCRDGEREGEGEEVGVPKGRIM